MKRPHVHNRIVIDFLRHIQMGLEGPLCRTIGCSSPFAKHWEWPHRYVCTPMTAHYIPSGVRRVPRETPEGEQ